MFPILYLTCGVLCFIPHHQKEKQNRPSFAKVQIKNDKKLIAHKQEKKKEKRPLIT